MAPEAKGANETSRRAENTLTGRTRFFLLLDKASSNLFRAVCSLLSNSSVSFERFGSFSQLLQSLSFGLLFVLKLASAFRAVCSLF